MEKKRQGQGKRVVLSALLFALLFGTLTVGGTLSLYNNNATFKTHLVTGGCSCGLYLKGIVSDVVSKEDGSIKLDQKIDLEDDPYYRKSYVEGKGVDLSSFDGDVLLAERFLPSMKGEATFSIENRGKSAFTYAVDFTLVKATLKKDDGTEEELSESSAITKKDVLEEFTFTTPEETKSKVEPKQSADFTVGYRFNKDGTMQNLTMSFDILVVAKQA